MSKPDILAVAKLHPFYQKALDAVYTVHDRTHVTDPAAFAALAPRIVGVAGTGEASVPRSLLSQLPNAKVVSVFGVGYDGVDVVAALEHGIPVTHTPDVLTDDVADLAMGLVLSVGRTIPQADQFVRAGQWPSGPIALARKVSGARLGIVGLGRIGKAIARRASGFGMSIAYTARTEKTDSGFQFFATAAALAAQVDFLVVITPGRRHQTPDQCRSLESLGSPRILDQCGTGQCGRRSRLDRGAAKRHHRGGWAGRFCERTSGARIALAHVQRGADTAHGQCHARNASGHGRFGFCQYASRHIGPTLAHPRARVRGCAKVTPWLQT